ncbi:CPBP family intramembrane glutamic endopeptidase [Lentilactobacillus kisonensis]|uniref:CAAX amino terminal protease family protein n=1 Tax=Lentilactobacillus kisonensis DSM 19906 = JCM 15041 TaxID=1423766 RepID=A0A0R1NX87_9LACO|nr:CPBP family intramembrane glutamic endopeptidase [Lentilactobacillus kisonensis]KRL22389.1 CAAX amino terminal protease family protein [Lentilactobacillus kisonensis DSM 19906 = JCM 15041]
MKRFWFERKTDQREFPLLDTKLDQWRLWALLLFVSIGTVIWVAFAAAMNFKSFLATTVFDDMIPAIIMIGGVLYLSQGHLLRLFGKPRWSDFGFGAIMFILQLIYAYVAATVIPKLGGSLGENGAATQIGKSSNKLMAYFQSIFSDLFDLMNEELLSIVIFLTIAALLIQYYHLNRRAGLGIAMLASMFIFGMLHFQTYNWNLVQMLAIIAIERFFLNATFIRSKTIWPSYVAHMVFDGLAFLAAMYYLPVH